MQGTHETRGIVVPCAPDIRSTALLRQKSIHKVIKSENNRALVPSIHSGDSRSRSVTNTHISARKTLTAQQMHAFIHGHTIPKPQSPTHIPFPHSIMVTSAKRTNNQQPMRMNWKGHSTVLVSCFPPPKWESIRPPFPAQTHIKMSQKGYIKAQKTSPEAGEDGSVL